MSIQERAEDNYKKYKEMIKWIAEMSLDLSNEFNKDLEFVIRHIVRCILNNDNHEELINKIKNNEKLLGEANGNIVEIVKDTIKELNMR